MQQLTLSPYTKQRSIDQRFHRFHTENPRVYDEIVARARMARERGYTRIGIELIFASLRWDAMMRTTADEYGFKLNNDFRSRYARLIMQTEADLDGIFETRKLTAP